MPEATWGLTTRTPMALATGAAAPPRLLEKRRSGSVATQEGLQRAPHRQRGGDGAGEEVAAVGEEAEGPQQRPGSDIVAGGGFCSLFLQYSSSTWCLRRGCLACVAAGAWAFVACARSCCLIIDGNSSGRRLPPSPIAGPMRNAARANLSTAYLKKQSSRARASNWEPPGRKRGT